MFFATRHFDFIEDDILVDHGVVFPDDPSESDVSMNNRRCLLRTLLAYIEEPSSNTTYEPIH